MKTRNVLVAVLLAGVLVTTGGCGNDHSGHDHGHEGHDHKHTQGHNHVDRKDDKKKSSL